MKVLFVCMYATVHVKKHVCILYVGLHEMCMYGYSLYNNSMSNILFYYVFLYNTVFPKIFTENNLTFWM